MTDAEFNSMSKRSQKRFLKREEFRENARVAAEFLRSTPIIPFAATLAGTSALAKAEIISPSTAAFVSISAGALSIGGTGGGIALAAITATGLLGGDHGIGPPGLPGFGLGEIPSPVPTLSFGELKEELEQTGDLSFPDRFGPVNVLGAGFKKLFELFK